MKEDPAPAMGQWSKAPLVFVLAQVRFANQPEGFTEKLQQLIDQLEPGRFLPAQPMAMLNVTVEMSEGVATKQSATPMGTAYQLIRKDGQMAVRINPNVMTLSVTEYKDAEHFRGQWLPMVKCLAAAGLESPITRIGLRYVDFVIPKEGKTPEHYLQAPWNMEVFPKLPGAKGPPGLFLTVYDVEYPEGRMRLQYMRGYGRPALPTDLQGDLSPILKSNPEQSAIIDTDRWMEKLWKPDDEQLFEDFKTMHSELGNAFRSMITTSAHDEWNPPRESA